MFKILARKYEIHQLEDLCLDFIKNHLDIEIAFDLLSKIRHLDDIRLQFLCWRTLETNASSVIQTQQFLDLDQDFLCEFLSRDNLNVDENELFQAVSPTPKNSTSLDNFLG